MITVWWWVLLVALGSGITLGYAWGADANEKPRRVDRGETVLVPMGYADALAIEEGIAWTVGADRDRLRALLERYRDVRFEATAGIAR